MRLKVAFLVGVVLALLVANVAIAQFPVGRDYLVARVYLDSRCDGFYQAGPDIVLPAVPVIADDGVGTSVATSTNSLGLAPFTKFDVSQIATLTVSVVLPATFKGFNVSPCPNQPVQYELTVDDFRGGNVKYRYLEYRARLDF